MTERLVMQHIEGTHNPDLEELHQYPFIHKLTLPSTLGGVERTTVSYIKDLPADELVMKQDEAGELRVLLKNDNLLIQAGLSKLRRGLDREYSQDSSMNTRNTLEAVPLLTREGAYVLGRAVMAGQQCVFYPELAETGRLAVTNTATAAWSHLVLANRQWVAKIAGQRSNNSYVDAHQWGELGLMHAASMYDYRKGFAFSTYARNWIVQAISRGDDVKSNPDHLSLDLPLNEYGYVLLQDIIKGEDGRETTEEICNREVFDRLVSALDLLPKLHKEVFMSLTVQSVLGGSSESQVELAKRLALDRGKIFRINIAAKTMLMHPSIGLVAHSSEDPEVTALADAVCLGEPIETFFPAVSYVSMGNRRKYLCGQCPVKSQCEAFAVNNKVQLGHWGNVIPRRRHHNPSLKIA